MATQPASSTITGTTTAHRLLQVLLFALLRIVLLTIIAVGGLGSPRCCWELVLVEFADTELGPGPPRWELLRVFGGGGAVINKPQHNPIEISAQQL